MGNTRIARRVGGKQKPTPFNCVASMSAATRVIGLGSPHGDDQAGWRLIETLRGRLELEVAIRAVGDPTELLDCLDGCRRLVIVDACHTGAPAGTITRLSWPDPRILHQHRHSTHRFGVPAVLHLAQQLHRLPEHVVLLGVEVAACHALSEMSEAVASALEELQRRVLIEIGQCQDMAACERG